MNQERIIAELEEEERRLETELKKVREAKQSLLGKGRSYPRSLTVREALLQLLKAQDGQIRRDLPTKLAGIGAPCYCQHIANHYHAAQGFVPPRSGPGLAALIQ